MTKRFKKTLARRITQRVTAFGGGWGHIIKSKRNRKVWGGGGGGGGGWGGVWSFPKLTWESMKSF